ncbi:unnamed protein product [Prunus armeniaca]|uniref:Uncharacterized protein n=1 Tax=Prunus armeniaca TaxID=36596 RepID=A0A6J5V213_PRUAR|nr:unnamed protein product [Prunus armeniaca]
MANHEEEEEERKSGTQGGAEEEEEWLRSVKQMRHAEEQRSMMKDWDLTKTVYLCFGTYGQSADVFCNIESLDFSSSGVRSMKVYSVGAALNGMGIGAYGSKIVFAGGYEGYSKATSTDHVQARGLGNLLVGGSNIFVSTSCCPIYRFDMADPNHQWKQHIFTDYPGFSIPLGCETLAVETRDGDWVLFTCKLEVHRVADDKDYPKGDDYWDMFDVFDRLLEWKDTSMIVYLMSKDLTSLTALEPLKLTQLNTVPLCARNIEPYLVHLGAQTVGLILSADTGNEAMREKEIFFHDVLQLELEANMKSMSAEEPCLKMVTTCVLVVAVA